MPRRSERAGSVCPFTAPGARPAGQIETGMMGMGWKRGGADTWCGGKGVWWGVLRWVDVGARGGGSRQRPECCRMIGR